MNAKGEPVALLHPDCLRSRPDLPDPVLNAERFRKNLVMLGFHVVELSEQEQLALAANSVSNPNEPGMLLFTRDRISPSLVQKLAEVDVEAVPPNSENLIGYAEGGGIPMFGLHCLTLNILIPVEEKGPKDGL